MKEIKNKEFKKRIIKNLDSLDEKPKKDFMKIFSLFNKSYIIGGFVRDSILQELYEYKFPLNDLDILVSDKNFKEKTKNFPNTNKSRFGSLKLKYNNFDIDVMEFSQVYFLKNKKNLENFLKGCDLSTSSIAYDLEKNKLYNYQAIEDIYKKEINLIQNNLFISPTICRLILHADKMDFKLGDSAKKYIKKNYSKNPEKINKEIKEFVEYKKIQHTLPLIENTIKSMVSQK